MRGSRVAMAAVAAFAAAGCSGSGVSRTIGSTVSGASTSEVSPGSTGSNAGPTTTVAAGPAAPANWPTYHHDAARTGVDPSAPPAGPLSKAWTSAPLDGAVYSEPLVVGDRVIATTEGDSVFALAAATGAVLWSAHLGTPMAGGDLPCGNIDPSGITSTPVVDTAAGLVWVVPFVRPGRHDLVALDLATGQTRFRQPADPPGASPLVEQQRGALTLIGGTVYVPYGGLYGDCGAYHGFVLAFSATGTGGLLHSWQVPTAREGGIWAPPGVVADAAGNLFVATGNTQSRSAFDDGNAVVRLSPALQQQDVFAPANWVELSNSDTDLGSLSPSLLPGGLVFQAGKEGIGYLLAAGHLGGVGGQAFSAPVCSGAFGGTAVSGSRLFVPCTDGLFAVDVGPGPRFTIAWKSPAGGSGSPVVAGGVVWMLDTSGRLWGFDQQTGRVRSRDSVGSVPHFPSLGVGGGRLFAPAGSRIVSYEGA
jgi:outer membrane protein assembly factor BamB